MMDLQSHKRQFLNLCRIFAQYFVSERERVESARLVRREHRIGKPGPPRNCPAGFPQKCMVVRLQRGSPVLTPKCPN